MPENRQLESVFLWGLTAALAVLALLHWGAYVMEAPSWRTSWPAIPLTAAAIATAIGAVSMKRRGERVRLMR